MIDIDTINMVLEQQTTCSDTQGGCINCEFMTNCHILDVINSYFSDKE